MRVLAATACLLAGVMLVHLTMLFLTLAPPNALTARHGERIQAYVQPEFGQDWKLFAPNPMQRNDAVGVRVRTRGENGAWRTSEWVNLTARDIEAIRGNPVPSHVHQNMLRRAWENYMATHDEKERPTAGTRAKVAGAYLKRVVLQRIGRSWQGEPIVGLQLGGRFTMVPPPSWSAEKAPDTTTYRMLPWWPVTNQDYREL